MVSELALRSKDKSKECMEAVVGCLSSCRGYVIGNNQQGRGLGVVVARVPRLFPAIADLVASGTP